LGGFDSHTLPPRPPADRWTAGSPGQARGGVCWRARRAGGRRDDGTRASAGQRTLGRDAGHATGVAHPAARDLSHERRGQRHAARATASGYHPPVSAKSAFFSSLLLLLGQAKLDRSYAGALFFATEMVGIFRLRQAEADLHYAQRHVHDSTLVVQTYEQDGSGNLQFGFDRVADPRHVWVRAVRQRASRRPKDARRGLGSGARLQSPDIRRGCVVAAQLWDLPAHVRPKLAMTDDGRMFYGATVTW